MIDNRTERKITCPKCGLENLSWRSRCENCGENLHTDERKVPKFEGRGTGFWIALLAGIAGLAFLSGLAFLAIAFSGYFPVEVMIMLAFPVLGLVLCWKWPRIAGVVLIIGGILPIVLIVLDAGFDSDAITGYLFLLLGIAIPLVVSGILFMMMGRG